MQTIPASYVTPIFDRVFSKSFKAENEADAAVVLSIKMKAFAVLVKMGAASVPELRRLMKDDATRWDAVSCLQKLGKDALPALPEITDALRDSNHHVRNFAVRAILKFGPDAASAVPNLAKLNADEDEDVRIYAMQALGALGEKAKSALPTLEAAVKSAKGLRKLEITKAIENIKKDVGAGQK